MIESLRKQIVDGALPVGAILPSAALLAKRFEVSIPVVREALADLRAQGLVASRQGAPTIVRARTKSNGFRISPLTVSNPSALAALYEFRCDVESAAAAHAAERARPADIKAIGAALRAMHSELREPARGTAADVAFHVAIARAAGPYHSQLIGYMIDEVSDAIATARRNSEQWRGLPQRVHEEHEAIHDAIAIREPVVAHMAMHRHLTSAARRLNLKQPKGLKV